MAAHEQTCLVCGKKFTGYDASPTLYCSVGCAAPCGAGGPLKDEAPYIAPKEGRARAARLPARRGQDRKPSGQPA